MADTSRISPSKSSYVHHCEVRAFAIGTPHSPPSPPPCGCYCFLLRCHKGVKKQKKYSEVEQRRSKIKAKIQQGKARDDDVNNNGDNNEWRSAWKEIGPQGMDAGGLFDVKSTEEEFRRASKKEKQLTQEAQKFLKKVAS